VRTHRALGASLAGGLLAVSVLGTAPVGAQDEVTLDLWNFGAMGLEELITQYSEENPGVAVEYNSRDYDGHHQALLTALATGEVPDIAAVEVSYSSQFKANPQNFVDLRTLGAEELEADYVPWRWAQGVAADGSIIGIPTDLGGMAMCYRTDLFEAAGLPTDPAEVAALWPDWESFIEVGKQFVANSDVAFIDTASGTLFNLIQNQGSDFYYDNDGNLIYETNPQVRKAFDISLAGVAAGLSANIQQFQPEWNAGMANGDFAVLGCPAWMMNYIQGQAPDTAGKWGITAIPEVGGNWGGTQLVIPAASDNPQEAYDMIKWLLSPENQLEVFKLHGNFPSVPALYDTPEIQDFTNDFFPGAPVGQIFAESAKAVQPIFEGPQQRAIDREFENAILGVEAGQIAPEAAWDTVLQNVALAIQG
jgi:cellobiose transport system substrate-binding protein